MRRRHRLRLLGPQRHAARQAEVPDERQSVAHLLLWEQRLSGYPERPLGHDDTADEFLTAIPKRSIVAIGLHGFSKRNWQKAEWHCFLEKLIESREPIGIIVYGNPNETIFGPFKGKCDFFFYEPWISQRRRKGGNPDVD
jgi:hypothetical protein